MPTTFLMEVIDFRLSDYETIWALQKRILEERLAGARPDTLLLGEHPHVITLGRGTHAENLLAPDIPIVEIERGGDVTYHGPGQLIAYPILQLPHRDLHRYLRDLEEALIQTLAAFEITGVRNPGWTGVWVETPQGLRKLASIGVAVRKWVTYHGIALNVTTDLAYFRQINPCGLESQVMSRMADVCVKPVTVAEVKPVFAQALAQVMAAYGEQYTPLSFPPPVSQITPDW